MITFFFIKLGKLQLHVKEASSHGIKNYSKASYLVISGPDYALQMT